jgi:hypothetical protein
MDGTAMPTGGDPSAHAGGAFQHAWARRSMGSSACCHVKLARQGDGGGKTDEAAGQWGGTGIHLVHELAPSFI